VHTVPAPALLCAGRRPRPFGIEFKPDPDAGGIQIEFTQAVSEPPTYAMLLGGLLAVGAVTARHRRTLMAQADPG